MSRAPAKPPPPAAGAPADQDAAQTGALLAELRGVGGAAEAPLPGRARRRISSQTVLTLAILLVGAGMLYGMRRYGMKSGMTFQVVHIDWEQARPRGGPSAEEARILSVLTGGAAAPQVPTEEIDKNPFLLTVAGMGEGAGEALTLAERLAELARQRQQAREAEIKAALASIELQSIVTGTRPVAKINGKVHAVGDTVAQHLRITAIDGRSVTLEADGKSYVVEIGAPPPR